MAKLLKFGGSSVANAEQYKKVKDIVEKDKADRKIIVVSAPGKSNDEDIKVTDLLITCQAYAQMERGFNWEYDTIRNKFESIVNDLDLHINISNYLDEIKIEIEQGATVDYVASRGEYLNGLLMADYLNYEFIDPIELIKFSPDGKYMPEETKVLIQKRLKDVKTAVIPGFYGADRLGNIHTFSRGGSDLTGSIIAAGINAEIYENWTDVSGFLMADPRIVDNPKVIEYLTYRELRELSYMGATVLHDEVVYPLLRSNIPINLRNTNSPDDPGTMVVSEWEEDRQGIITGISGKKNFSVFYIESRYMNEEVGFMRKILSIFEEAKVPVEHAPSGMDTVSIVVNEEALGDKKEWIFKQIQFRYEPDYIEFQPDMALLTVVGKGMVGKKGTSAKLFKALADHDINVRMISQDSLEMNIIVGVENKDLEKSVRAIYNEFNEVRE